MLTPLEIQNKLFKKSLNGYNQREVEEFNAMVVTSMEELININIDVTNRVKQLESELTRYKEMESTIKEALVLAQKTSEDLIQSANEKSKYVVERAEDDAKKIISDANSEVLMAKKRLEEAKQSYWAFNMQLKVIYESQLSLIEREMSKEE